MLDDWRFCSLNLRQFLKGWGANRHSDSMMIKHSLSDKIRDLSSVADASGLDVVGWERCYPLKAELVSIHKQEELFWRQRGRLNWTLKGDTNSAYFHALTNGHRRTVSFPIWTWMAPLFLNLWLSRIIFKIFTLPFLVVSSLQT